MSDPARQTTHTHTGDPAPPADSTGATVPFGATPDWADPDPPFGPPQHPGDLGRLGRYRILRRVGRGGMGAVYLGSDDALGRRLAIKVMLPRHAANPAARRRFLREARAAATVRSEHVVTILDVDEDHGTPFIVMDHLAGTSLDRHLAANPRLTVPQAVRVATETVRGLAAAHALGLVHRDIKPANLWLEAPNGRVKILDFGLARDLTPDSGESEVTGTGAVVGTPAYMSPEQARGEPVDRRTDLFSLGVVLYRLLTGRLPFPGATAMAVLTALATTDPAPVRSLNPDVPPALEVLVHRLLAKDPAARPQSAEEVLAVLAAVAEGRAGTAELLGAMPVVADARAEAVWERLADPSTATGTGVADRPRPVARPQRRAGFPWLLVGGGLAAAVIAGGLLVVALQKARTPEAKTEPADAPPVVRAGPPGKTGDGSSPSDPGKGGAADAPAAEWRDLFDGKTLAGWVPAEGWSVEDGAIRAEGSARVPLVTAADYTDYHLALEFWLEPGTNSGLFPRRRDPTSRPLVKLCAPATPGNPTNTTGSLLGLVAAHPPPDAPLRAWNRLTVRAEGKVVRVSVNGTRCAAAEVPEMLPSGRIALVQDNNGVPVRFRNIRLREPSKSAPGFFTGTDLSGWTGDVDYWKAANGELGGGPGGGDRPRPRTLASARTYRDFRLSFQTQIGVAGGGPTASYPYGAVFFRAAPVPDKPGRWAGPRCNVGPGQWGVVTVERPNDDADPPDRPELDKLVERFGMNDVTIRCVGKHVTVTVNGTVTTDADFPDIPAEGRIVWHVGTVTDGFVIRDIRFEELNSQANLPGK